MVLFTELFVDNKDNIEFVKKNLSSQFIKKVVVFVDDYTESLIFHSKIIKIKKRFRDSSQIFEFAKSFVNSDICVISNSYLSELPIQFLGLDFNSKVYHFDNQHYVFKTGQVEKFRNIVNLDSNQKLFSSKNQTQNFINTDISDKMDVIIISVDYNDYLSITLKNNLRFVQNIHVVTSSKDLDCQQICSDYGVDCIITDTFYESNSPFNKGKAINYAISKLKNPSWILILDADIVLKNSIDVSNLNYNVLYSCKRIIVETHDQYLNLNNQELVEEPGIGFGYFQLFNFSSRYLNKKMIYPELSRNASKSDVIFKRQFKSIEDLKSKVYHLGETRLNWNGRKSEVFVKEEDSKFDINSYFDKIYCINLDKRSDRWENVKLQFEENNINVERWSAVDGTNIPDNFFNDIIQTNKSEKQLSNLGILENKYALACLLSHLSVIKDAKYKKYKKILIFEDDISIENEFNSRIGEFVSLNWMILYLGCSQFRSGGVKYTNNNRFYYANQSLGTFAYAIKFEIYDEIINLLESKSNIKSIDNLLADVQKSYPINCFVYNPNIVTSELIDSDIREKEIIETKISFELDIKLNKKSLKFNKLQALLNLVDIKNILEEFKVTYWLTDGTLLGLYRQGDFISHDMDTDIGVLYESFNPIVIGKIIERGFSIHKTYGLIENGFEIAFMKNGVKTDLFFFYSRGKFLWHAAWHSNDGLNFKMIEYTYDKFEVSQSYFYGYRFNTPKNTKKYIVQKYGKEWQKPNSDWDWKFSPENHLKTKISFNIEDFENSKNYILSQSNLLNKVTLIIKSFKRESSLVNLILSIRKFYKFIKIIIVDDSDVDINIPIDQNIEFYKIEFDSGLSRGRNYAVSKVKTEYFVLLDDDFEFTNNTDLEKWLSIIENSDLDILGGDVIMNGIKMEYTGLYHFDISESTLIYKYGFHEDKKHYKTYDFILNFFIARTNSIVKNKWDDDLKLAEHTAFFFDNKGKIKVGHVDSISIDHQKVLEGDYIDYRKRGTMFFNNWMIKKNIKKTINLKGEEYICRK